MPPRSTKRPSRSTTLRSVTRRGRGGTSPIEWEELADAAVPPDLDGAAEAVEAVETLHEAAMAGESGRSRVTAAAETAWAIRDRYADAFPLPPDRIAAILEDLGDRIGAIYQAEVDALDMTAQAIAVTHSWCR